MDKRKHGEREGGSQDRDRRWGFAEGNARWQFGILRFLSSIMYWATRSSVCSFARTALVCLPRAAHFSSLAPLRSFIFSLVHSLSSLWESE